MAKRARSPARLAEAVTGDGDLVGDIAAGRQSLSAVPEAELPDTLRRMTPAATAGPCGRQLAERRTLNERLAGLVRQRDRHVADTRAKAPRPAADCFDRAVEKTLRAQIRK